MDENLVKSMNSYDPEKVKEYELTGETEESEDYFHDKKMYERFHDKSDMISQNKTERFINTILLMQEHFDNIEILNEPMIQGDSLLIKIKENNKVLKKEI